MEEIDVFKSMRESVDGGLIPVEDEREAARLKLIAEHKAWLKKIKKEHPSPYQFFKVGVYIRYFNQTKYERTPERDSRECRSAYCCSGAQEYNRRCRHSRT